MPLITENGNTYWMPEVFPVPTKEYQATQAEKRYLTEEGIERMHPGWTYAENVACVDDEYLFQNEGWKVVIGEAPLEPVPFYKNHYIKNAPEEWNEIDERTIEATYTLSGWIPEVFPQATKEYQQTQSEKRYLTPDGEVKWHSQWKYAATDAYVDDEYLFQNDGWQLLVNISQEPPSAPLKKTLLNDIEDWEELEDGKTVRVTYKFVDFTEEEVAEYTEQKWEQLRNKRDRLLQATDWVIVRAMEEDLVVSTEVTTYRQALRDFPETIENILEFEINNNALWVIRPEVYFAV